MSCITLKSADALISQVQHVLTSIYVQLGSLLPDAEIEHIGATAVPGAVTKGDVDVVILVAPPAFQAAIEILKKHFSIKQPTNWTKNFASFGDDASYDLPLGIQLVIKGSEADSLVFLRNYLILNPDVLTDYNRLKVQYAKDGPDAYWKAKDSFLSRILVSHHQ